LLSGAPFDDPTWWLLSNEDIVKARNVINDFAGSRRMLAHTVITPKQPGWAEEVDKAIAVYKPDSWKAYMRRQTSTVNYSAKLPLAQGVRFDV